LWEKGCEVKGRAGAGEETVTQRAWSARRGKGGVILSEPQRPLPWRVRGGRRPDRRLRGVWRQIRERKRNHRRLERTERRRTESRNGSASSSGRSCTRRELRRGVGARATCPRAFPVREWRGSRRPSCLGDRRRRAFR